MRRFLSLTAALLIVAFVVGFVLPATADAAPPAQGPSYHVVRPGENLSSIASRYGYSVRQLVVANNLRNPNYIYAGQTLYLPANGTNAGGVYYRVRRGDTLSGIAFRYGTSVAAIRNANRLRSSFIYAGQLLRIPVGGGGDIPPRNVTRYCVRYGDTLSAIARRYGTSVRALMSLNRMNSTRIYAGQCILVDP